jgi:alpha-amylase
MAEENVKGVMFQYFEWNCKTDGSLWRELAERAIEIKNLGTTAVWMPPAYKGMGGKNDTGYAPYDLYDLGEFDQKGSVGTKYGTKAEFLAAIKAVQDAGMDAYADVVMDHRMGGDELEEVEVVEIANDNRNMVVSEPRKIKAYAKYNFAGRGDKYSSFKWRAQHFVAFGYDDITKATGKIYRAKDKNFSGEVSSEHGNFDYLMGADVDQYHEDVRREEFEWGKWFIETTNINGFRLDAVKHMPSSFYVDWFAKLRAHFKDREIFAVGEYWSGSMDDLRRYIDVTKGTMRLFDVPLHYKLCEASKKGRDFDLSKIFDNTLVKDNPLLAVTFVDNHDSQPGQSLESWVDDWFKPLAYALVLLRNHGYPCLFYGDYFGSPGDCQGNHPLTCHRKIIDDFIGARQKHCFGELHDYFDHPQCVGWLWTGEEGHPEVLAVLMSTGEAGFKKMQTGVIHKTFRDITGHWPEPVTTDANGDAEFHCPPGSVSVWITT